MKSFLAFLESGYSVAAGALMVAVFLILGRQAFLDYQRFGDEPLSVDTNGAIEASAGGRQWVAIHGAPWRCDATIRTGHTFFPARSNGIDVVARFDHDVVCENVVAGPLVGVIEQVEKEDFERFQKAGMTNNDFAKVRLLNVCKACGKDNARLGVIICGLFVIMGLAIYPLRRGLYALHTGFSRSVHTALHSPGSERAVAERKLRIQGLATMAVGGWALAFGKDWVLWHAVPLPWVGAAAITLGVLYVGFPGKLRDLAARSRQTK